MRLGSDKKGGKMQELILSPANRRYGRKTPPPMPAHRMLTRGLPAGAPLFKDFRKTFCGPVKDQGQEGSCTGHAFSSCMEWINRAYLNRKPILSPQYFYARELLADGTFPNDEGSDGLTGCGVSIVNGCCEASLYPYVAGDIVAPTADQDANAAEYALGAYHGVADAETAISCLSDPVPWPVEIGFSVYESFESDQTAQTGVMQIPDTNSEELLGGHEVAGTGGYDIGVKPTIRPKGCPPAILIQNSWGTSWGLQGFFWMPLAILNAKDTDIKIAHAGKPWK
jgi:Papain family cysteine protease